MVIFFKDVYLLLLCCVSVAVLGLSLLAGSSAALDCHGLASHCGGFSLCGAQPLGSWAQESWRTGFVAPCMWDLPRPGIEPVSPALTGGFLSTVQQGSPAIIVKGVV